MSNLRWVLKCVFILSITLLIGCDGCGGEEDDNRSTGADDDDCPDGQCDDDIDDDDDDDEEDPMAPVGGDPLNWSEPFLVASANCQVPSIRVFDADVIHGTYFKPVDGDVVDGYLNWITLTGDTMSAQDPVIVTAEAYRANWIYNINEIQLVASRYKRHVLIEGDASGESWIEIDWVHSQDFGEGSKEPTTALAKDPYGRLVMAYGYEEDRDVMGRYAQTKLSYFTDDEWQAVLHVGDGLPAGIYYVSDTRIVIPTNMGLYISDNSGIDFDEISSDMQSNTSIRATDSVLGGGSIWMVYAQMWENGYRMTLIKGNSLGSDWVNPYWVLGTSDNLIVDPKIAIDGNTIIVVWCEARSGELVDNQYKMDLFSRVSWDGGETWSEESRIGPLAQGVYGLGYDVDVTQDRTAVFFHSRQEDSFDGQLYLVTASLE